MFFGLNLSSFLNGDRHNWIPCFWNHPKLCWTIMQLSTKKNQEQVAWLPRCFWGHPKGSTGLMTWIFKLGCEVFCFSKQILGFFYQLNTFSVKYEKVLCILIILQKGFQMVLKSGYNYQYTKIWEFPCCNWSLLKTLQPRSTGLMSLPMSL